MEVIMLPMMRMILAAAIHRFLKSFALLPGLPLFIIKYYYISTEKYRFQI